MLMDDNCLIPDEILTKIFSYCTLSALHNVMQTCRRFNSCASVQSLWKAKLAELTGWKADDLKLVLQLSGSYKDCCRRFCHIFNSSADDRFSVDSITCLQCHDDCHGLHGVADFHDEMIVFDFGSKTTWFKYTGDSGIGQLSMHPTVIPVCGPTPDDRLCPICMRVALRRFACPSTESDMTQSPRRLAGCFTKLSLRNLDCFSSITDGDDADTEQLTNELERSMQQKTELGTVDVYTFLMEHMLKRNPCFRVSSIPFVICEPTSCDDAMRRQLAEYLLCHLKVPEICFVPKAIAIALYTGHDTCLVVDTGANNTVVTPIINHRIMQHAVRHIPVGGSHLTRLLLDCMRTKGLGVEISEASVDSSQVKRECYIAYNTANEARRKINQKSVFVKGYKNNELKMLEVQLSHELYQAAENMYLQLELPNVIADCVRSVAVSDQRCLLSNIILTGGNSRLSGLANRLVHDLEVILPRPLVPLVRVIDPRLMTGRSDVVIGAAYVRKWRSAHWISRRDYVLRGLDIFGTKNDLLRESTSNSESVFSEASNASEKSENDDSDRSCDNVENNDDCSHLLLDDETIAEMGLQIELNTPLMDTLDSSE